MSLRNLFHKKNSNQALPSFDDLPPIELDSQPSFSTPIHSSVQSFEDKMPQMSSLYVEEFPPTFKGPEDNAHYRPEEKGLVFDEDVVSPKIRNDYNFEHDEFSDHQTKDTSFHDSFTESNIRPESDNQSSQPTIPTDLSVSYADELSVNDLPSFDDSLHALQPVSNVSDTYSSNSSSQAQTNSQSQIIFIEEQKYASLLYKIDARLKSGFTFAKSDSLQSIDESLQKQFTKLNVSFAKITKQCQTAQKIFPELEVNT